MRKTSQTGEENIVVKGVTQYTEDCGHKCVLKYIDDINLTFTSYLGEQDKHKLETKYRYKDDKFMQYKSSIKYIGKSENY